MNLDQESKDRWRDRLYKIRHEPNSVRRLIARASFELLELAGLHVTADHFYEPVPNTRDISKKYKHGPRPCWGIDFNAEAAIAEWLRIAALYGRELYDAGRPFGYYEGNAYFRGVDALALYCILRDAKPKRVLEVGQGFSTRVSLTALEQNARETGSKPTLVSIDPYARFVPSATAVKLEVHHKKLQDAVDLVRSGVGSGDILFVDSSHVHKFGSDVELFFDEIYPKLAPGVLIHIHDVFSPYDYPISWLTKKKRFWNEQYHLENFLRFNKAFEVVLPLHLLMRQSEEAMAMARSVISGEDFLFLGQSIYLRRV